MQSLLSSPARLADASAIRNLKSLLLRHGVLGYRVEDGGGPVPEVDRLQIVPLIFGLMPAAVFTHIASGLPIKPLIKAHLAAIGVPDDPQLVDIVKHLCEQYQRSQKDPTTRLMGVRKYRISDVRLQAAAYRRQMDAQNGRCLVCGADFTSHDPTLDHVIPFRLVGDVADGSNWQFLCEWCNSAKGDLLSVLQSPQAHNWVYGGSAPLPPEASPHPITRYIVLVQSRACHVVGCGRGPRDSELRLIRRTPTGLAVADNLAVVCDHH